MIQKSLQPLSRRLRLSGRNRTGAAAMMAMLFLVMFTTLAVAMMSMATGNVQAASNMSDTARAQASSESGLRWMAYRFKKMQRPKTTIGNITPTVAAALWPSIRTSIVNDFATLLTTSERTTGGTGTTLTSASIAYDNSGATFALRIQQHPLYVGDPLDARYVRVTSTGRYRSSVRSVSMSFKIDKKVKFAVIAKVPIQLGRNTIVEGPVAMTTANKYPPVYMLSDFTHFDTTLKNRIATFNTFVEGNHVGFDGRISVNNTTEYDLATDAGYDDTNEDGYVDEYDLFLARFDNNNDKAVSRAEFTNPSNGQLYDDNLFTAIDSLNSPMFDGDPTRVGYLDDAIDNRDGYAKIRGQITLATSAQNWQNNLSSSGKTIHDQITGPIAQTDPTQPAVKFSADSSDLFDLDPANFEQAAANFRPRTGPDNGTSSKVGAVFTNVTLSASDANATSVTERTPFGSLSYQATYRRPVFRNMTFKNCRIPKGLNALFDNCTFEGVTFVETERDILTSGGSVTLSASQGMSWSQRRVSGDNFSKDKVLLATGTPTIGQTITRGSQQGNNVRFNNCAFEGPLAGNYATAYTHFANSWEFTGATLFDNKVDATATIVSPQVNIEMGSFTNPGSAPSTLVGVVVVGNLDIRGTSVVDGSVIITGDGAGNTTLAYFGPRDDQTDPGANPEGGFGRLNIRYNPHRALPDGINVAVDILPEIDTYQEGL